MGKYISFKILKHPKYKVQFDILNSDYISKEYSGFIDSLPKIYYDEDMEICASDSFGLNYEDWNGIGQIGSGTKICSEHPEFVEYVIKFWETICHKYFYEEVALFDVSEVRDEVRAYYLHQGKIISLYGEDLGFITSYCELAIKRYDESIDFNITGVDKEKIRTKIIFQMEQESKLEGYKEAVEIFKMDSLSKAKKILYEGTHIKQILIGGEGGIGKTTFILKYCLEFFFPALLWCANLFLKNVQIDDNVISLFIWDIMGQDRARTLVEFFSKDIDGAILGFDLTRPRSLDDLDHWVNLVRKKDLNVPILLLGFKSDLEDSILVDDSKILSFLKKYVPCDYLKVSAKMGENVEEAFNRIIDEIRHTPPIEKSRIVSLKKKITLLDYLKSYSIQGKEELRVYFNSMIDEEMLQEAFESFNEMSKDELVSQLLLFDDFKEELQEYIDQL